MLALAAQTADTARVAKTRDKKRLCIERSFIGTLPSGIVSNNFLDGIAKLASLSLSADGDIQWFSLNALSGHYLTLTEVRLVRHRASRM